MKCPHCPKTVNSDGTGRQSPEFKLAQHVFHRNDHPEISYVEAREQVISYNEGRDGDSEEVEGETPFNETGDKVGRVERVNEPPLQTAHVLMADGGEDESEESEEGEAEESEASEGGPPSCPSCNVEMSKMKEGKKFKSESTGDVMVADGGEYICPYCRKVKDGGSWH